MADAGTSGNLVEGDYIGVDQAGVTPLPNEFTGVVIGNGSRTKAMPRRTRSAGQRSAANVISGNAGDGIDIGGGSGNIIIGDFIGTDADSDTGLGNGDIGVSMSDGAAANTIGGTASGSVNVVAENAGDGIDILGADTSGNVIEGNSIGTSSDGSQNLGNQGNGISIIARLERRDRRRGRTPPRMSSVEPGRRSEWPWPSGLAAEL